MHDGHALIIDFAGIRDCMNNTKVSPGSDGIDDAEITRYIQLSGMIAPPAPDCAIDIKRQ